MLLFQLSETCWRRWARSWLLQINILAPQEPDAVSNHRHDECLFCSLCRLTTNTYQCAIFVALGQGQSSPKIARFMGPTWGSPGSCRPHMGPMLAPWTLLSGMQWPLRKANGCIDVVAMIVCHLHICTLINGACLLIITDTTTPNEHTQIIIRCFCQATQQRWYAYKSICFIDHNSDILSYWQHKITIEQP